MRRWCSGLLLVLSAASCGAGQSTLHGEIDAWGECAKKCRDTGDDLEAHARCEEKCAEGLKSRPGAGGPSWLGPQGAPYPTEPPP